MRWGVVLLLGLLGVVALVAQETPVGVIEGTVVDEMTGKPVSGARVVINIYRTEPPLTTDIRVAVTQADGRFRFGELPDCTGSLAATKNGFLHSHHSAMVHVRPLTDKTGTAGLVLKITPQGVISGRVLDTDGNPIPRVEVQPLRRGASSRRDSWQPLAGSTTNDRGEYRLTNLSAGSYTIRAVPLDTMDSGSLGAYSRRYYPNATDLNAAQQIAVMPGIESGGFDLRLPREPVYRVRVRLEGVSAELLEHAGVRLLALDAMEEMSNRGTITRRIELGLFELQGVRAGSWLIHAQTGPQAEPLVGIAPIEVVAGDPKEVVVALRPRPRITGRLVYEGPPVPRPGWRFYSLGLSSPGGRYWGYSKCDIADDGAFTLQYETPGKYFLTSSGADSRGTEYLASVRVGDEEYLGKTLDLTHGSPGPVTLTFRRDVGQVHGKVEGLAEAVPGRPGLVLMTPLEPHLRRMEFIYSSGIRPDGTFRFWKAPPWEYILCYVPPDRASYWEDGAPPRELLEFGVRLKVEPNGSHEVQLKSWGVPKQP